MADLQFTLNTAEVAVAAGVAKTILLNHMPANHRGKLLEWGAYFDGVSAVAEPAEVELIYATSSGTMSIQTSVVTNGFSETVQASHMVDATVEPSSITIAEAKEVHPQSGYEKAYGLGNEVKLSGNGFIGIRVNSPANVNVRGYMKIEE